MSTSSSSSSTGTSALCVICAVLTARIGYYVNLTVLQSDWPMFFAIMDFFFWPFAWLKWLIFEQVSMTVIKQAFSFFFN